MKFAAPKAVLFDLDGTLVDSAPDLIAAVTQVRIELGLDDQTPTRTAQFVSAGALAMLRAGLPEEFHGRLDSLRDRFLQHYAQNICVHSKLYDGASELLARLDDQGIPWGIVTNKPFGLARLLVDALALRPGALLGGDSLPQKKPQPEPLWAACELLGVDAKQSWMVGDDPRDIDAGRRAGCPVTIACAFGYLGDSAPAQEWGASWVAHSLGELRI